MSETIEVGAAVVLRGGSHTMTVLSIQDETAECGYFAYREGQTGPFERLSLPLCALQPVKPYAKKDG